MGRQAPVERGGRAAPGAPSGCSSRAGERDAAAAFARFLPEFEHEWTPDELELGAHAGPWLGLGEGPES